MLTYAKTNAELNKEQEKLILQVQKTLKKNHKEMRRTVLMSKPVVNVSHLDAKVTKL